MRGRQQVRCMHRRPSPRTYLLLVLTYYRARQHVGSMPTRVPDGTVGAARADCIKSHCIWELNMIAVEYQTALRGAVLAGGWPN